MPSNAAEQAYRLTLAIAATEHDVARAQELLRKSRTSLLSDHEWGALGGLLRKSRKNLLSYEDQCGQLIARVQTDLAGDALGCRALECLQRRLEDVRARLYCNDQRWEGSVLRIETALPGAAGRSVAVESRRVSGRALGSRFAAGYPAGDPFSQTDPVRYGHVPGLAQSVLVNDCGQILYTGLRHGLFCANELEARLRSPIADDDLWALVAYFSDHGVQPEPRDAHRAELIDEQCALIRNSRGGAALAAAMMVSRAYVRMARELACATLVADAAKYRRGLEGNTVDLTLYCISVLEPGEFEQWAGQAGAMHRLGQGEAIALPVRRWDGVECQATANMNVNLFVMSTTGERLLPSGTGFVPHIDIRRLIGEPDSDELGADLKARIDALLGNAARLRPDIERLQSWLAGRSGTQGMADPAVIQVRDRLSTAVQRLQRMEKDVRTLEEAGQQLKSMWQSHGDWPEQPGAWRALAPRLALVAHLMGATPVLSCGGNGGRTLEIETEAKFLATVADNPDGHLPPVSGDLESWRQAREAFLPH